MHFLFSSIHVTLVFSCCEYVNSLMIETGTTILLRLPKKYKYESANIGMEITLVPMPLLGLLRRSFMYVQ